MGGHNSKYVLHSVLCNFNKEYKRRDLCVVSGSCSRGNRDLLRLGGGQTDREKAAVAPSRGT